MNSIQLEYFLSIARMGSFTAASRNLHLTQPALSKQIQQLEEELGALLFIRRPHGIRLTPEGKKLLKEAEEIIRRIRNIPAELNDLHHTVSGELNIVCTNFLSRTIMPGLLKRLLEKYPGICPRIRETTARQHPEMLMNGSADIGLGNIYQLGKQLSCHPIFKSELVLIRSVLSPLAQK
ncbi:MAG: LysR family transcriptional regulator [Lentisphaeria bacterium]|nr:LysR family transcriptional regulator [Lentisphaeria bacterium]